MAKGPTYFSPDRYPERARERFAYVLKRMQEDKVAGAEEVRSGVTAVPRIVPYEKPRREAGFHFVDHLMREARTLVGMQSLTVAILHGALDHQRQAAARHRDRAAGRPRALRGRRATAPSYDGPELNLGEATARVTAEQSTARAAARPRHEAGLADRAAERAAAALRRALAGRGRAGEARRRGGQHASASACATAASCRCRCPSTSRPALLQRQRRDLRPRHRRQEAERGQGRAAHPPEGAGRGAGAGEQDRPHPGDGRRLLLSAEPAQPHHARRCGSPARRSSR